MKIFLLILISLFFSSCSKPTLCVPKKIYVKSKVPRLKILYDIPKYEIKDFYIIDSRYYGISKIELHKASEVSQKRIHKIMFYEKQNNKFNKEFVDVI